MSVTEALRVLVIFAGALLIWLNFWNYAKKNLTEIIAMVWALLSVMLIIVGIIPQFWGWASVANERIYILFSLLFLFVIIGLFALSISVSKLLMKNQELAINLSLLNQENEKILEEMVRLTGESERMR